MQYWSSDVAGLEETLPPLFEFISRLAKSGERAAKDLYGCRKGNVCKNYLKMLSKGRVIQKSLGHWDVVRRRHTS